MLLEKKYDWHWHWQWEEEEEVLRKGLKRMDDIITSKLRMIMNIEMGAVRMITLVLMMWTNGAWNMAWMDGWTGCYASGEDDEYYLLNNSS
jgi:hypothetical protein